MRILYKGKDGGPDSPVTGYWLIEIKSLFSVVLLRFDNGCREAYHNHAFNAYTWWLKGVIREEVFTSHSKFWKPSFKPKYTPREHMHRITSYGTSWALSLRGPWQDTWQEFKDEKIITLTHGRKQL